MSVTPVLHPYQTLAVNAALAAPMGRWIFNDEMGLGKTAELIISMRHLRPSSALIVCPAMVRANWKRELKKWWPEMADEFQVLDAGSGNKSLTKKKATVRDAALAAQYVITSYGLMREAAVRPRGYIAFDEVHLLQKPTSIMSKVAREIRDANPGACIQGATATLLPNQPEDAWNPLDIIWPDRFGPLSRPHKDSETGLTTGGGKVSFKYLQRYTNMTRGAYGWVSAGVHAAHSDELRYRISKVTSRTTRAEVQHLLPAIQPPRLVELPGTAIEGAVAWAKEAITDSENVVILTFRRSTAAAIAQMLKKTLHSWLIVHTSGKDTPGARDALIQQAQQHPRSVLVATMHSVGRGISLAFAQRALFAELYWRPETLEQAMGRFGRLGGVSTIIDLLVKDRPSQLIAMAVAEKLEAAALLTKEGQVAAGLREAFLGKDTVPDFAAIAQSERIDPYNFFGLEEVDDD